jgi:hypothetical protein
MSEIDLSKEMVKASLDPFWAWLGHAIEAYAGLEQSLCRLFCLLSGTEPDVAAIIFFRIRNTRNRDEILGKLLRRKHGSDYSRFWNSLVDIIQNQITPRRNEIAHWKATIVLGDNGFSQMQLKPPDFWSHRSETPFIDVALLQKLMETCAFVSRLCNMFGLFINPSSHAEMERGAPPEHMRTWRDIFSQAVAYPPPSTHPLFQKPQEPESPPPPSQESPQPEKPPGP